MAENYPYMGIIHFKEAELEESKTYFGRNHGLSKICEVFYGSNTLKPILMNEEHTHFFILFDQFYDVNEFFSRGDEGDAVSINYFDKVFRINAPRPGVRSVRIEYFLQFLNYPYVIRPGYNR